MDKRSLYELFKACRLCGAGAGYKMPIIQNILGITEEIEIKRKINECLQLEVRSNDKMPPLICELCVDKVNDFYEFFQMCKQTNVRTRKRLGLPLRVRTEERGTETCMLVRPTPAVKNEVNTESTKKHKVKLKNSSGNVKCKTDSKLKVEIDDEDEDPSPKRPTRQNTSSESLPQFVLQEPSKKFMAMLSKAAPKSKQNTVKSGDASRSLLKRRRESDVQEIPPAAKKQRSIEYQKPGPKSHKLKAELQKTSQNTSQPKTSKSQPKTSVTQPKTSITQPKTSVTQPKMTECLICHKLFKSTSGLSSHLTTHVPNFTPVKLSCNACFLWFETAELSSLHHLKHTHYKCIKCRKRYATYELFNEHLTAKCIKEPIVPEVKCAHCWRTFLTNKLYKEHKCYGEDGRPGGKCSRCNRNYTLLKNLIKHESMCTFKKKGTPIIDPAVQSSLLPMQVRLARCDNLLRPSGGSYDVSHVDDNFGLDPSSNYPYLPTQISIKCEPVNEFDYMVSINDNIKQEYYQEPSFVHWDSDSSNDNDNCTDTDNYNDKNAVKSLTSLSLKVLFSDKMLGKVPRKLRKAKNVLFPDISNKISNIIDNLNDDDYDSDSILDRNNDFNICISFNLLSDSNENSKDSIKMISESNKISQDGDKSLTDDKSHHKSNIDDDSPMKIDDNLAKVNDKSKVNDTDIINECSNDTAMDVADDDNGGNAVTADTANDKSDTKIDVGDAFDDMINDKTCDSDTADIVNEIINKMDSGNEDSNETKMDTISVDTHDTVNDDFNDNESNMINDDDDKACDNDNADIVNDCKENNKIISDDSNTKMDVIISEDTDTGTVNDDCNDNKSISNDSISECGMKQDFKEVESNTHTNANKTVENYKNADDFNDEDADISNDTAIKSDSIEYNSNTNSNSGSNIHQNDTDKESDNINNFGNITDGINDNDTLNDESSHKSEDVNTDSRNFNDINTVMDNVINDRDSITDTVDNFNDNDSQSNDNLNDQLYSSQTNIETDLMIDEENSRQNNDNCSLNSIDCQDFDSKSPKSVPISNINESSCSNNDLINENCSNESNDNEKRIADERNDTTDRFHDEVENYYNSTSFNGHISDKIHHSNTVITDSPDNRNDKLSENVTDRNNDTLIATDTFNSTNNAITDNETIEEIYKDVTDTENLNKIDSIINYIENVNKFDNEDKLNINNDNDSLNSVNSNDLVNKSVKSADKFNVNDLSDDDKKLMAELDEQIGDDDESNKFNDNDKCLKKNNDLESLDLDNVSEDDFEIDE